MSSDDISGLIVSHKPISEYDLKRLILIFDKIYFVHPNENLYFIPRGVGKIVMPNMEIHPVEYLPLYQGKEYKLIEETLIDKFDSACKNNIVNTLDPTCTKFYQKNWLPLRLAYDFDTADIRFLNLAKELVVYDNRVETTSGVVRGLFIQPSGIKLYPDIPAAPQIFDPKIESSYHCDLQMYSIIAKLNRAASLCGKFGFIPIFSNQTLADIFFEKATKISNLNDDLLSSEFLKIKQMHLANIQHCLSRMSEIILPKEILDQISIKELIIARDRTFHDLIKFRRILKNTILELSSTEFNQDTISDINDYIQNKFEPEFKKYQTSFFEKIQNFLRISIPCLGGITGAGIGFIKSLNPYETAMLTGISASVGNWLTNLTDYVTVPSKKNFRNTFGYLLKYRDDDVPI